MSIWKLFKNWWTGSPSKKKKKQYPYILGNHLHIELIKATTPKRPKHNALTSDFQLENLSDDISLDERYPLWKKLSSRERDVTALTCLKYTNPQIAARLGLSVDTVRSYLEKVLNKLSLQNKADLRVIFAHWDFSAWERRKDPYR